MWHKPPRLADAEIDRGLAEQHRRKLAVNVGDVHERDVADGVEAQQFVLGETLLRKGSRYEFGHQGGGRGGNLEKIAPREHAALRAGSMPNKRLAASRDLDLDQTCERPQRAGTRVPLRIGRRLTAAIT